MPHPVRSPTVWNVPNRLSAARVVLAIGCFACLALDGYWAALGLFVAASVTDWLDGYWARRFNQITQLGRILDPFADKLLICGVFVYLAATPGSRIGPTAAVIVLSRELLVTALRSFVESGGGDFSAQWAGKWKMVAQCAAVIASLGVLGLGDGAPVWLAGSVTGLVVLTVLLTLYSGWGYVWSAIAIGRQRAAGSQPVDNQRRGEPSAG